MRVATAAASKAAACIGAAEESDFQPSAAGDLLPTVVHSPRGEVARATSTSAASSAGAANRNVDEPGIKLYYSGELNDPSDLKATPHASESPGRTL
uniref:Uncharacterized protein n=1 Tax=Peronospora matthiolae TaxID=2874970 RepID=A0AAV1UTK6_9STRA